MVIKLDAMSDEIIKKRIAVFGSTGFGSNSCQSRII